MPVLVLVLLLVAAGPVRAEATLDAPQASPLVGNGSSVFTFAVDYRSTSPARPPDAIYAALESATTSLIVPLVLVDGEATDGRYAGSRSGLAPGVYSVTFHATAPHPATDPAPRTGPSVTVVGEPATPTPAPTATPAPTPTTPPTPRPPVPTPRPTSSPRPPGATPRPTPRPTATTPAERRMPTPAGTAPSASDPGASPAGSQTTTPSSSTAVATSTIEESGAAGTDQPRSPLASAEPEPAAEQDGPPLGAIALMVLGGATSAAGLVMLGRLWAGRPPSPSGRGR